MGRMRTLRDPMICCATSKTTLLTFALLPFPALPLRSVSFLGGKGFFFLGFLPMKWACDKKFDLTGNGYKATNIWSLLTV